MNNQDYQYILLILFIIKLRKMYLCHLLIHLYFQIKIKMVLIQNSVM